MIVQVIASLFILLTFVAAVGVIRARRIKVEAEEEYECPICGPSCNGYCRDVQHPSKA